MPMPLGAVSRSPNNANAASSDSSKDNRCAASLRTMPACRTDAASARKIVGSRMPSAASASHGAPGSRSVANDGCSSDAVSALVTT